MSILDRLRSVVDRVVGATVPATGTPPVTPQDGEPLSDLSVAQLRAIIRDHDRGIFAQSGLLSDLVRHDADVMGALQQRLLLQGAYETKITGPDGASHHGVRPSFLHSRHIRFRKRSSKGVGSARRIAAATYVGTVT